MRSRSLTPLFIYLFIPFFLFCFVGSMPRMQPNVGLELMTLGSTPGAPKLQFLSGHRGGPSGRVGALLQSYQSLGNRRVWKHQDKT